ncbi:AsnC family transcriptional regulator [Aureimonas ureilytica]|uniref:AsnC family transcriptional regulator n=1 Tax=Aureimonas ureilytica TaxID=401562 RepID=A0A175RRD9_9HYPH|nr:Lrp/AsnC family transcriptional regulator [Aureimonas ureilytica]KTR06290.1 AsnC family transcriptional regulator [Aureimonas ureilytica]
MDDKDRQIIAELQANARLTNSELAERVNLSPSPCLRRVRLLEEAGILKGYTAIVDTEACGYPVTAFVRIRLQPHNGETVQAFEAAIAKIDVVMDSYVMAGNADYMLRVVVRSLKHYETFIRSDLHSVPGVASIDTSFTYGHVKHSLVLPIDRDRHS